jgi:hypothetical protein
MSLKSLGIILFLVMAVIGFSCSSVNAYDPNPVRVEVQVSDYRLPDNFRSFQTSIWTSKTGESWTEDNVIYRDKLGKGQYKLYEDFLWYDYNNLQVCFRFDVKYAADYGITLRISNYDGSTVRAKNLIMDWATEDTDGYIYYHNQQVDLSRYKFEDNINIYIDGTK